MYSYENAAITLRARLGRPFSVDDVKKLVSEKRLVARTMPGWGPAFTQLAEVLHEALGVALPSEEERNPTELFIWCASIERFIIQEKRRMQQPPVGTED